MTATVMDPPKVRKRGPQPREWEPLYAVVNGKVSQALIDDIRTRAVQAQVRPSELFRWLLDYGLDNMPEDFVDIKWSSEPACRLAGAKVSERAMTAVNDRCREWAVTRGDLVRRFTSFSLSNMPDGYRGRQKPE